MVIRSKEVLRPKNQTETSVSAKISPADGKEETKMIRELKEKKQ